VSTVALSLALGAAFLHAFWNAIVKAAGDRAVVLASISAGHTVIGLLLVTNVPLPDVASWPYILASTLIHYAYYVFLFFAYRWGDLSQVYPISRGIAPMLVALGAFVFAAETLSPTAMTAIVLISLGIAALVLGSRNRAPREAVLAALATGVMIASYSVVDGIGVRLAGTPFGYMGWLFLLEFPVVLFVLARRPEGVRAIPRRTMMLGFFGGICATLAYGLVIYAKTIAPLAAVSAIRESSVIVAALIGVWFFGERPWQWRIICAAVVALGVVLLALAPG